MTAIDLITRALRTAGVYGSAETPSAADAVDSLAVLNEMLDSWSVARLYVYQIVTNSLVATVNKSTYTIGAGGDFNVTRPTHITHAIYSVSGIDYTLRQATRESFASIPFKAAEGIPELFSYEPSHPLGVISLWCTPGVVGTINIQSPQQLTEFPTLATDVELPPGYEAAIRLSLAVALRDEFDLPPKPVLSTRAAQAVKRVRRLNVSVPTLNSPMVIAESRNIITGFN